MRRIQLKALEEGEDVGGLGRGRKLGKGDPRLPWHEADLEEAWVGLEEEGEHGGGGFVGKAFEEKNGVVGLVRGRGGLGGSGGGGVVVFFDDLHGVVVWLGRGVCAMGGGGGGGGRRGVAVIELCNGFAACLGKSNFLP